MKRLRFALASLAAAAAAATAGTATAAALPTCTAGLTILTSSTGDVTTAGNITIFRSSGVSGTYTSGFLAGYSLTGSQDIVRNDAEHHAVLAGQFVATGPGGTFTVRYTGTADLTTGAADGHFAVVAGTGAFTAFRWIGDITAQLVSLTPPTFLATDTGICTGT